MMRDFDLRTTLAVLFGVSLAIANVTASKLAWFDIPIIGTVAIPAGFVAIGVAFLCSDLLVEFYGREYAHKVVNGTVLALILAYALIYVAIWMPVAPFYGAHEAYITTLSSSSAVIAASIITILFSQHIDVRVFSHFKEITNSNRRWLRNIGSTTISQAVDTTVFILLAFSIIPFIQGGSVMWGSALFSTILGQYIAKLFVAVLDTIPFYIVTGVYQQ